jgi:hypothetical protein
MPRTRCTGPIAGVRCPHLALALVGAEWCSSCSGSRVRAEAKLIVVCARTKAQAETWARTYRIPPLQWILASPSYNLALLRSFVVVTLPGFHDRSDAAAIEQALVR